MSLEILRIGYDIVSGFIPDSHGQFFMFLEGCELPSIPEDVVPDGTVDMKDVSYISSKFGAKRGDSKYEAKCDLNNDGTVDMKDIARVARIAFHRRIDFALADVDVCCAPWTAPVPVCGVAYNADGNLLGHSAVVMSGVGPDFQWVNFLFELRLSGVLPPYIWLGIASSSSIRVLVKAQPSGAPAGRYKYMPIDATNFPDNLPTALPKTGQWAFTYANYMGVFTDVMRTVTMI